MKRFIFLPLLLVACAGPKTPKYGINVDGTNDLTDVDTAWERATAIGGFNPEVAKGQWIYTKFQTQVIQISTSTGKYAGLTSETSSTIRVVGDCLLDAETPTVHELLHVLFYIETGDNDAGHTHKAWKQADQDFGPCAEKF